MKERELPVIVAACLLSAVLATTQAQEAKPDIISAVEKARAAGLDAPAIPVVNFSLDEMRELGSMEAMLERVVEHAKAHVGDDVLLAAPLIPPDLERMMQAIESGDDGLLNEALSDIAGVPVRLPTEEEQRLHDEGASYAPRRVRATTDEVLASMRPERAAALADYRHLLDDELELIASLDNIKGGLARSAAREFLAKVFPEPGPREIEETFPPEMKEQIRHARERARERGWYDPPTPPRGQSLLREAERLGGVQSSLSAYPEIPATAASYSFDMPPDSRIRRLDVVSDTKFGGVLYAETSEIADIHFPDPNLHIMGHDGWVRTHKYPDGTWATALTAFDGWYKYEVVLEQKLEDEQRDEFVRMATAMIEGDLSRFPEDRGGREGAQF